MELNDINEQAINNPLSKEELKKQFIEKTKELGLMHTFTFEEAWEVAQEIRRKKEFRQKIEGLEKQITEPGVGVGDVHEQNPTKHTFVGGCYVREIYNPAGLLLITKIHKVEHPFFLMKGKMSILTEDGIQTIEAPYNGITKVGTKRVIYTHEPCTFITVHSTDKKDVDEIEDDVIAKDFSDKDVNITQLYSTCEKMGLI